MTHLFLAWQHALPSDDARRRAWFPIGRLDRDDEGYHFVYTDGAQRAERESGFYPQLLAFPDLHRSYHSHQLFSLFQNRVLNASRSEYPDLLRWLDLPDGDRDPMKILAISGGKRQTDNLEVFPRIAAAADGGFSCRFFVHGMPYKNADCQERMARLVAGEPLGVALETTNPITGLAMQLQTSEYQIIGWAPQYLIEVLISAITQKSSLKATVVRVNPSPAPMNHRLLVELSGYLPAGMTPMSGPDFLPLV